MRNSHPFRCPRCGDTAGGAARCVRCDVELVDADGVPPLAPRPRIIKSSFPDAPPARLGLGLAVAVGLTLVATIADGMRDFQPMAVPNAATWIGLGVVAALVIAVLANRALRQRRLQPGVRARFAAAGAVTPIAQASGSCHVRGVARLLQPLDHPVMGKVGAYRLQHDTTVTSAYDEELEDPVTHRMRPTGRTLYAFVGAQMEETSACGRFAVVDETGIAVVDDDAFDVGRVGRPFDSSGVHRFVAVRDGQQVEIIGPAKAGRARDAAHLQQDGISRHRRGAAFRRHRGRARADPRVSPRDRASATLRGVAIQVFGLTGGIGSGKSSVAARFRERGLPVIDADRLAREVVAPGSEGLSEIVAAFGEQVLDADGALDRARVADIVFNNEDKRRTLNAITHPRVRDLALRRVAELGAQGEPLCCYEVPLLVESGLADMLRPLVVVSVEEDVQVARTVKRDGSSEAQARARIAAQMPLSGKVKLADHVIDNSGTPAELEARADEVLDAICDKLGVDKTRYPRK